MQNLFIVKHNGQWVEDMSINNVYAYTNDKGGARLFGTAWLKYWQGISDAEIVYVKLALVRNELYAPHDA